MYILYINIHHEFTNWGKISKGCSLNCLVAKRISHWREVQEVMRSNLALGILKFFNN